jgi:capsular exopolysaccharide synthesis family protein
VGAVQEFSTEQQQVYRHKVETSEARLDSFRRTLLSNDLTGSSVTQNNLARVRALVDQANLDLDEQRQRVSTLRQQIGDQIHTYDPARLSSPETQNLLAQIMGLERQVAAELVLGSTEGDGGGSGGGIARTTSARKTAELEIQFTQNATKAFPNATPDLRDALVRYRLAEADMQARDARRAYLAGQVGSYEQNVVMTPDREAQLARLQQEVETNRAFYNAFLQQSAAAQIAEAFENAKVSGRLTILDPADLPRKPSKPNRPVLILLALVIGGIVSVSLVLVVEQQDQSMKNAEEVETVLGMPVIGAIPRVEELDRARRRGRSRSAAPATAGELRDTGLLHRLRTESPLGLEFRRIYLKLAKTRGRTLPSTLVLTSSTRGEGKTTITACLAITLARELEQKVLLVDFDLRSPALHRALGLPSSSWGLAQMLAQHKFDERFVRSTVLPHLDFLAAGKSERPTSDLVDTENVEWFVKEARARYPLVIMDTAPNLAVPDPLILGHAAEGVLYVIKAGQTVRKAAEYGVKVQREARDNILGVLLNDVGESLPHYYGYRNAYGYTDEAAGGES